MIEQVGKAGAVLRKGASDLCNRAWWVFLIGGIASVVFGILAFVNPGAAWLVLSMFFAAWVLVDGAVNIWGALSNRDKDGWWAILLLGVAGVLAGGYALLNPPVSMMVFVYVVAFIAMFIGITSLYLGWRIRREIPNEWILYLSGALSVLFALLILFNPEVGGLSVVYLIASWAIVIGVLRIWFATRVRKLRDRIGTTVAP
jgi:uncharacterized membrane protein HdeD (DUF308 family)